MSAVILCYFAAIAATATSAVKFVASGTSGHGVSRGQRICPGGHPVRIVLLPSSRVVALVVGFQGYVKQHLPVDAFVRCSRQKGPEKTLFLHVEDSGNIVMADLQRYLELVCSFFRVSPVGDYGSSIACKISMY